MARHAVLDVAGLDDGFVLAPERYDPRRRAPTGPGPTLADLVCFERRHLTTARAPDDGRYVVLDTGDAQAGMVRTAGPVLAGADLGSTKKIVAPGRLIISRLRPYLRQVAWIDAAVIPDGTELLCSTEFHVLAPSDERSIAFLVPFLLSAGVQSMLSAAQEGGHHPRFNENTLRTLPVPSLVLAERDAASACVERAIDQSRRAWNSLSEAIERVNRITTTPHSPAPAPSPSSR